MAKCRVFKNDMGSYRDTFRTRTVFSFAATAALSLPLHAQTAAGFSGEVALSSQLVDRGLATTPVTPVLQGVMSWTSSSGWSLGLSGGVVLHSPDRLVESIAQASHYWVLSDRWQMQAGTLYYSYPGNARARAYDRVEPNVSWSYRDLLTVSLSAVRLVHNDDRQWRGAVDAGVRWPLVRHVSLSAGLGIAQSLLPPPRRYRESSGSYSYDYSDSAKLYGYGHIGLVWNNGPWQVELDRIMIDPDARRRWNAAVAAPWVATLSWLFE